MKKILQMLFLTLIAVTFNNQLIYGQCNFSGAYFGYGAASAFCTPITGTGCAYFSEYTLFNGLVAGNTYSVTGSFNGGIGPYTMGVYNSNVSGTAPIHFITGTASPLAITFTATAADASIYVKNFDSSSGSCSSPASTCNTFVLTCTSCSAPTLGCAINSTPANGATGVSLTPSASWSAVPQTTSYDIYLGTTVAGAVLIGNATGTSANFSGLLPNTTYFWYVVPKGCGGSQGVGCSANATSFTTQGPPPANDNCTGTNGTPVALTPQAFASSCSSPVSATTVGATRSNTDCSSTAANDDVWFVFTAAAPTQIVRFENVVAVTGTVTSMGMNLYTTCGGTSTNCNPTITLTSGAGQASLTGLAPGTTYLLRVWTDGTSNSANFNICITTPPPPANNNCTGTNGTPVALTPQAFASSCSSPVSATTVGATQSNINCGFMAANDDVWFVFTAAAPTQIVRFENVVAVTGTVTSMGMNLYTTCSGTSTNCNTIITLTSGAGQANLTDLTSGTTYLLRVWTGGTLNSANFNICIINPPPPANDNCAGAIALTVNPDLACGTVTPGTTVSATQTSGETAPSCGATGINDDVWFTFQATGTVHRIQTSAVSTGTSTMQFQVYSGACGSLSLVTGACATFTDMLDLTDLTAGTTYTIRVATASSTVTTNATFNICVGTLPPPPANDNCAGAVDLTPVAGVFTNPGPQTTVNATQTLPPVTCGGFFSTTANDVWYKFTTDANGGTAVITTTGADFVLQGFSGACNGTNIGCADVAGTVETLTLPGLAANTTYLVRAYRYSTSLSGAGSAFTIDLSAPALPLELASFTGKTESRSNMLRWETLTEKNVQWHIVERSVDGIKWMEVGKTAGQMDAQVPVKYELEDRAPLAKAYYRLRSVDYDGAENFSNSIVLTRKGEHFGITAAYPSPTKNQLTVQFASLAEETVTIQVTDFAGRLVLTQEFDADNGINEAVLQLANLQTGVYLVRISNATATVEPMRIVKE